MKIINKLVTFMAMAMLSVSALADKEPRQGFYIAPEISTFTFKNYCRTIRSGFPQTTSCSESEIGFGLLAGYQFDDFVAVEAGIRIASGFDFRTSNMHFNRDYKSFSLGGAWRYPIGEHFAITGRAGYHFWDVEAKVNGVRSAANSLNDKNIYAGVGLELIGTDKISFQSEYTRYELENEDADVISFRLVILF